MARQIRKKSGTGIYHIMLRGAGVRQISTLTGVSFGVTQSYIIMRNMITRTDPVILSQQSKKKTI